MGNPMDNRSHREGESMSVQLLSEGIRTARKKHQCFHCYKIISPGTEYRFQTNKYDGVYTLAFHLDCDALWWAYERDAAFHWSDFEEGYPPLKDHWSDSGEFENLCNAYRGMFHHAICRLELLEQKTAWMDGKELHS